MFTNQRKYVIIISVDSQNSEYTIKIITYRDVAQVVERYFREVEAASSSLVIPIHKAAEFIRGSVVFLCTSGD